MPSKKLIALLQNFSSIQQTRFEKYLTTPYFNERDELLIVYKFIVNESNLLVKELDPSNDKKRIWTKLFKNDKYNDAIIRRLLSDLNQQALSFLAIEQLDKRPEKKQLLALEAIKDYNLDIHFNGILRNLKKVQENSNIQNADHYYTQYKLHEIEDYYAEQGGMKIENMNALESADLALDAFYLAKKLRHYCDVLAYQHLRSLSSKIYFSSEHRMLIKTQVEYYDTPAVKTYFLIAEMLENPEVESFYHELSSYLYEKGDFFPPSELNAIYVYLKNYCIHFKINIGRLDFFSELFNIFQVLIKKRILLRQGKLDPQDYKNIITVGLQVKEFAWTEAFIQTYTPKLPPEERENALTYNLAKVYFAQQQYEKVIEQLREVEYDNLTYALGGKLMLLKTYYELNEYLALDSLIDSFRVYLRRNQTISKDVRQQYLNVLRFIKKMSNVRPGDRPAIAKIEQQIQECKNLADKGWIVSKVEELKGLKV